MSLLLDIQPSDLGLPSKFKSFRAIQADAADLTLSSLKQFICPSMPVGSGKSLYAVLVGLMSGGKTVYVTATKGLQDQINSDFSSIGMVDVKGKSNYPCRLYAERHQHKRCDYGEEMGCHYHPTTLCPSTAAVETGRQASLVSTNYAYWLHARRNSGDAALCKPGEFVETLILDEGHEAFNELARFLQVFMPEGEIEHLQLSGDGLMSGPGGAKFKAWAVERKKEILAEMRGLDRTDPDWTRLDQFRSKLHSISTMDDGWVWQIVERGVEFDCIWPGRYSSLLWSGIPRVVIMSGTLRPYALKLLGLERSVYEFKEYPSSFPPNRGMVYHIPTVKLSVRSTEDDYRLLVAQADRIIEGRLDRKGIIQTKSYDRMRKVLHHSRFSRLMIFNENSSDSSGAALRFRSAKPPAVLVSPSFSAGHDFAGDQCEYQIVLKVPYPYAESRVMQERCKDVEYRNHCAVQDLVQQCGRGMRSAEDRCQIFILDNNIGRLIAQTKQHCPGYFKVHKVSAIPAPSPKL